VFYKNAFRNISVVEYIRAVRQLGLPTFLSGHSLGGAMAANVAYFGGEAIDGLVLVNTFLTEPHRLSRVNVCFTIISGGWIKTVNVERSS